MFLFPFRYLKYNFTFDFFQKNHINPFYKYLYNNTNNKEVLNKDFSTVDSIGNAIHEIKFIPSFFNLKTANIDSSYKLIKFQRVDNFQINLEGHTNAEGYIKSRMGAKSRSQLRRRLHRLETCFNIKYVFYYGNISKQDYDFLINKLEVLIKRRFVQRGDTYSLKDKWADIKENTFQFILEKKASLFVIYAEDKPIDICLSYHFQNIMHHVIRSYDIDYSKFWVGQIDLLKQLEFCFANNFKIFDLMWGALIYKKRWSNTIIKYDHHFIYKNNHVFKTPFVRILIRLYKTNDALKNSKSFKSLHKAKNDFIKMLQSKPELKEHNFKLENISEMPLSENIYRINIESEAYAFIRKPVYDFQYLNFEFSINVKVFKIIEDDCSFIIKGVSSQVKVVVSNL
jgi:hypothetical protein